MNSEISLFFSMHTLFFDVVDNISFGLLPEDQRPTSRGESVFGETKGERLISNMSPLIINSKNGIVTIGSPGADRISSSLALVINNYTKSLLTNVTLKNMIRIQRKWNLRKR